MQKRHRSARLICAAVAMAMIGEATIAATVTYDSASTAGIQTTTGTWNFNSTVNWTTNGGVTRTAWTSNSNIAEFQMPSASTITVNNANGAVGAYGLIFSGTGNANTMYLTNSGSGALQLGAGGIVVSMSNHVVQTMNLLPIALTTSQTWSSTSLRTNSNGAAFKVFGTVSGAADLTLDGNGLCDPYSTGNSNNRVSFLLGGDNTYVGTTTVTGGAALVLDYTAAGGSRLEGTRPLVLSGGSVVMNGNPGSYITEVIGSTTVNKGGNTIYAGANGGGGSINRLVMGALTHNLSGTLDLTVAVSNIASTTTINTNGIIGGWATMGGGASWAVGSASGTGTAITNTSGTSRSSSSAWLATDNVNATAAESGIASKTINALRISDAGEGLTFAAGSTLTVTSGGIIAGNPNQYLAGGKVTTGSGELFVHTPNAFTISSEIADNGATPTNLVKAALNSLTLTADNTFTGATFVNSGSLILDNGGSLANANVTITAGSLSAGTTGDGGTLTFNVTGATSDLVTLSGGKVDLTNLKAAFAFDNATAAEYVLVDKAVGSSFVLGSAFAGTNLNPALWAIDYDGTALHPGSIVLTAVPEPGTVALFAGIVCLALVRRERRSTRL